MGFCVPSNVQLLDVVFTDPGCNNDRSAQGVVNIDIFVRFIVVKDCIEGASFTHRIKICSKTYRTIGKPDIHFRALCIATKVKESP